MSEIREKIMAIEPTFPYSNFLPDTSIYYSGFSRAREIAADIAEAEVQRLEAVVDRLRGQLQNCVDHLEHVRRKQYSRNNPYDKVIEDANRALYETLLSE